MVCNPCLNRPFGINGPLRLTSDWRNQTRCFVTFMYVLPAQSPPLSRSPHQWPNLLAFSRWIKLGLPGSLILDEDDGKLEKTTWSPIGLLGRDERELRWLIIPDRDHGPYSTS